MKTSTGILVGVFGLMAFTCAGCAGCVALYGLGRHEQFRQEERQQQEANEARGDAAAVAMKDVLKEYQNNIMRADEVYKGRYIRITGYVIHAGKSHDDRPELMLVSEEDSFPLVAEMVCRFPPSGGAAVMRVNRGQKVDVVGKCEGKGRVSVILENCQIVTPR